MPVLRAGDVLAKLVLDGGYSAQDRSLAVNDPKRASKSRLKFSEFNFVHDLC
jgi:hypothetical protein